MDGKETWVELIVLNMLDIVAILGVDWSASSHATLGCHLKVMRFNIPNASSFLF